MISPVATWKRLRDKIHARRHPVAGPSFFWSFEFMGLKDWWEFKRFSCTEMSAVEAHKTLTMLQESAGFNGEAPTPVRLSIIKDRKRVKEVYPSIYRELIGD